MKNISIFFGESIVKKLPRLVNSFVYANGELVLNVDYKYIDQVLFFLRNHSLTQYKALMEMTGVDYPDKAVRFELVYCLLSIRFNSRVRIKVSINGLSAVKSVTSIYSSAN
jgi:NADH:ubiquinone oxidoreductase subunit C